MVPIGGPKTSVRNCHHSLRNDPEVRISHPVVRILHVAKLLPKTIFHKIFFQLLWNFMLLCVRRERVSAVGWGTALQVGRSRVRFPMMSLKFFIDIILPAALWPCGWLKQKWVPGIYPGGKGGRCVGLTTLPPSCADFLKSGNLNLLEPSGPVQACNGIALPLPYYMIY